MDGRVPAEALQYSADHTRQKRSAVVVATAPIEPAEALQYFADHTRQKRSAAVVATTPPTRARMATACRGFTILTTSV